MRRENIVVDYYCVAVVPRFPGSISLSILLIRRRGRNHISILLTFSFIPYMYCLTHGVRFIIEVQSPIHFEKEGEVPNDFCFHNFASTRRGEQFSEKRGDVEEQGPLLRWRDQHPGQMACQVCSWSRVWWNDQHRWRSDDLPGSWTGQLPVIRDSYSDNDADASLWCVRWPDKEMNRLCDVMVV